MGQYNNYKKLTNVCLVFSIAPTATTSGPNGSIFFLNCGINASDPYNGGWTPPTIRIDQLVITSNFSSPQAVAAGVFGPCAPFYDNFLNASAAIGGA